MAPRPLEVRAPGSLHQTYLGVRFDLRHIGVEVTGGYAFNRFYFEGEGYSDRFSSRIDVEAARF